MYGLVVLVQGSSYLLVLPIVTRTLGAEQYGVVAVSTALMQMLAVIAPLGLTSVVAWDIYEGKDNGLRLGRRLAAATALVAASMVAMALLSWPLWRDALGAASRSSAPVVAMAGAAAIALLATSQGILQALRRPGSFAVLTLGAVVGGQAAGLLLVHLGNPTATLYLAGVTGGFAVAGVFGWVVIKVTPWRIVSAATLRRSLAHGGPTVVHGIAFIVLAAIDRLLVERDLGLREAGRYQIAYLIGGVTLSALQAINFAWAPLVYGAATEERWKLLADSTALVQRLAALIVGVISLASPIVLGLAVPDSYSPDDLRVTVAWVAAAAVPFVVYLSGVHVLFQERRTTALAWATPAAAAVNIALNLLLIPALGLTGAAVATFVAYATWSVMIRGAATRVQRVPWDTAAMRRWGAIGLALAACGAILPAAGSALYWRVGGVLAIVTVLLATIRQSRSTADPFRSDRV